MKTLKRITDKEMEATRAILNYSFNNEKAIKTLIDSNLDNYLITPEYVGEFKQFITIEQLSAARGLTPEVIEAYPSLFDMSIWAHSPKKSIQILTNPDILYAAKDSGYQSSIYEAVYEADSEEITETLFTQLFGNDEELNDLLLRKYHGEINEEFIIKNMNSLGTGIFRNISLKGKLTKELLDRLIREKDSVTLEFFIMALTSTNKLGWKLKMLEEAEHENIKLVPSSNTIDKEMKMLIAELPEDEISHLFNVATIYNKNALSYSVLEYCLENKEFEEDFIINNINVFKEAGLLNAVLKYSKDRKFESVTLFAAML